MVPGRFYRIALDSRTNTPRIQRFAPIFAQGKEDMHVANPIFAKYVDYEDLPIVYWRNVKIYMDGLAITDKTNPSEKYFFIPYISQHYHFLVDLIAVFWYIKLKHPEIRPYVLLSHKTKIEVSDHPDYYRIKELGFDDQDIHIALQNKDDKEKSFIKFANLYSQSFDIDNPQALHQYDGLYDILRNKYFGKLATVRPRTTNKYYISRRGFSARSIKNEEVLEEYFISRGYLVVYLEEMKYSEQADIFSNAETVVTRSGSSLTNMLFATQRTKIVEICDSLDYPSASIEWKIMADKFKLNYINVYVGNTADSRYIIKRLNQYMFNL